MTGSPRILEFRCAVCGATVAVSTALPWKCPNASADDPYHVLHLSDSPEPVEGVWPLDTVDTVDHPNPFVRYRNRMAWWQYGRSVGLGDAECLELVDEVARDFTITPFVRSAELSERIGRPVWVKDETSNVGGSHKGRHLASILLHLRAAERCGALVERPPLAIASCGNAARAAATLASRAAWSLEVYIPDWADDWVSDELGRLGAAVRRCKRRVDDPPGDPSVLRFREAVAAGAIPFSVQGPENALCLDGGRTIGWEIADQARDAGTELDEVFVQVGGGAFAACLSSGLGPGVRLNVVQAEGCAPLDSALRAAERVDHPEHRWSELMKPWPDPSSIATGILDDETYDWLALRDLLIASRGRSLVVSDQVIAEATDLFRAAGWDATPTGAAGLAGALFDPADGRLQGPLAVVASAADPAAS